MTVASSMDPVALHAAFLPLADARAVQTALARANVIAEGATTHCVSVQFKSYRRPESWERAQARVCYRITQPTKNPAIQDPESDDLFLQGWARLVPDRVGNASQCQPLRAALGPLNLMLWRLPEDDALPGLRPLWNLPRGRRHMHPRLMSYRPGARALLRYPAHDGTPVTFAKTFPSASLAQSVYTRTCRVHACADRGFDTATPLALDGTHAALWQLGMPGARVADLLPRMEDVALPPRLAQAVVALHAVRHDGLEQVLPADILIDTIKKLDRLRMLQPTLDEALRAQRKTLERGAGRFDMRRRVALHGDLHLRQWLLAGDRLTLCDLDEMCLGAPEVDVASLLFDLSLYGLPAARVDAWIIRFTDTYAARAPWGLDTEALRWHLRVQAVNKMHRAWVQLHADLRGRCEHYLSHLHTCLGILRS